FAVRRDAFAGLRLCFGNANGLHARGCRQFGHQRGGNAYYLWKTVYQPLPAFAVVPRTVKLAAPRAEVNARRFERIGRHPLSKNRLIGSLLREPAGEGLPGAARIKRPVNPQAALWRAAKLIRLHRNDVNTVRIMRVDRHGKTKIRRQSMG